MTAAEVRTLLEDAATRHEGQIHLRYCQTLSVQPGWEGLRLFAAAPALAAELLARLEAS